MPYIPLICQVDACRTLLLSQVGEEEDKSVPTVEWKKACKSCILPPVSLHTNVTI